jgi:hypothetical protein
MPVWGISIHSVHNGAHCNYFQADRKPLRPNNIWHCCQCMNLKYVEILYKREITFQPTNKPMEKGRDPKSMSVFLTTLKNISNQQTECNILYL